MNQNIFDLSIEILSKSNDGNELSPNHLALIQNAVNNNINGKGTRLLLKIHEQIIKGTYKKEIDYIFGVKHMTQGQEGSMFYKGITVEHFDHNFWCEKGWKKDMKKATIQLKKDCQKLEKKGIEINFSNLLDYRVKRSKAKREAITN